jgi:hypothetical protein
LLQLIVFSAVFRQKTRVNLPGTERQKKIPRISSGESRKPHAFAPDLFSGGRQECYLGISVA